VANGPGNGKYGYHEILWYSGLHIPYPSLYTLFKTRSKDRPTYAKTQTNSLTLRICLGLLSTTSGLGGLDLFTFPLLFASIVLATPKGAFLKLCFRCNRKDKTDPPVERPRNKMSISLDVANRCRTSRPLRFCEEVGRTERVTWPTSRDDQAHSRGHRPFCHRRRLYRGLNLRLVNWHHYLNDDAKHYGHSTNRQLQTTEAPVIPPLIILAGRYYVVTPI
jgi:hypothetical protein